MLQPVKIGCVWAADRDSGADLKVLQQFTACLLDTVPPEEEQTPQASKREKRDQQSECRHLLGTGGDRAPAVLGPGRLYSVTGLKRRRPFDSSQKPARAEPICLLLNTKAVWGAPFINTLPQSPRLEVTHPPEDSASWLFKARGGPVAQEESVLAVTKEREVYLAKSRLGRRGLPSLLHLTSVSETILEGPPPKLTGL